MQIRLWQIRDPPHKYYKRKHNRKQNYIPAVLKKVLYKIIQIVRALWLAIKPFYMSACKHGFRSSFISYFIKEM